MRSVGWVVVLLGLAAFGFVMFEAGLTPVSGLPDRDPSPDHAVAVRWLIAWAAVVGCAAVAILIRGLGELVMTRHEAHGARAPDGLNQEAAASVDADVNEGERPSRVPRGLGAGRAAAAAECGMAKPHGGKGGQPSDTGDAELGRESHGHQEPGVAHGLLDDRRPATGHG